MADERTVDVNALRFGEDFEEVEFMANSSAGIILQALADSKYATKRPPEVFQKALEFCTRFGGAVETRDTAAIDELYATLRSLSFPRSAPDGSIVKLTLHTYQMVALSNLNPSSVAAARALVPSLETFSDDEVGDMLTVLRRSSAKTAGSSSSSTAVGAAAASATGASAAGAAGTGSGGFAMAGLDASVAGGGAAAAGGVGVGVGGDVSAFTF